MFDKSGSFTTANSELRAKALRALYSLKSSLSYKSITTLFDTLVKLVLLYGCQIIAPHNKTTNYLSKLDEKSPANFIKYMAQDYYEKFHLKFLKWNLSVHRKASNIGCWGDSGLGCIHPTHGVTMATLDVIPYSTRLQSYQYIILNMSRVALNYLPHSVCRKSLVSIGILIYPILSPDSKIIPV